VPVSSNGSGPTPPSGPSSAPEGKGTPASDTGAPTPARRTLVSRSGWGLVVVAGAALASSWNPLGAPFALLAGILVSVIAVRRLLAGGRRRVAAVALALGAGAALAGVMVLLAAMGVGVRPEEKVEVEARSPAEVRKALDEAAARSREARSRAAKELQQLPPAEPPPPGAPERSPKGTR
jgi:hypothetical protein